MIPLSTAEIRKFQNTILIWYANNQRDLPWRKTRDPYAILVSEIMLQQTQVNRVIPKFEKWLKQFPTVKKLAQASIADVLQLWSGLGYNRRALNLKKTAQIITERYNGAFPQTEKELVALPGIGRYTARAVLCFAFDKQVAVVDINVKKVILTQIVKSAPNGAIALADAPKIDEKTIENIADTLLPHGKAYEWNQALMDYSSTVLKKEKFFVPKQSKFVGSNRYYRGRIVKALLNKKTIIKETLGLLIKEDFSEMDRVWFEKLLSDLEKEGFLVITKNTVSLNS